MLDNLCLLELVHRFKELIDFFFPVVPDFNLFYYYPDVTFSSHKIRKLWFSLTPKTFFLIPREEWRSSSSE